MDSIRLALDGDDLQLARWMHGGFASLTHVCARWAGNADIGEQIAARVVCVAWTHAMRGTPITKERAWLAKVVRVQRLVILRLEDQRIVELPPEVVGAEQCPLDQVITAQERESVREAIDRLPLKYRELMRARYIAGATEAEIAEWAKRRTGVGVEEVRRLLKKGRAMVAAILRGQDPRLTWPRRYSVQKSRRNTTPPPPFPTLIPEPIAPLGAPLDRCPYPTTHT